MIPFRYTVINKENQRLSGIINAENEEKARQKLNELGFSLLNLELSQDENQSKDLNNPRFEFKGYNNKGKKVLGSIPAQNRFSAYKKLIDQYKFDVIYLIPKEAKEKEKQILIYEGTKKLKEQYSQQETDKDDIEAKKEMIHQNTERNKIENQVSVIIQKAQEIIQKYRELISPNQKSEIENQINKILRIKNSSNLNFIRESLKELLEKLQNDEFFTEKNTHLKEKNRIHITTKKLLLNLNRSENEKQDILKPLKSKIEKLKNIKRGEKKFFSHIIHTIINLFEEDEEISILKQQIRQLHTQLFDYSKIWLSAPSGEKKEAALSIKRLWDLRKNTKNKLTQLKAEEKQKKHHKKENISIIQEINSFTGWLLAFYLLYYFIATYFLNKDFGFTFNWNFQLFNSNLLKYLISFIFIIHSTSSLKEIFFKKSKSSNYIIFPIGAVLLLLILFNF